MGGQTYEKSQDTIPTVPTPTLTAVSVPEPVPSPDTIDYAAFARVKLQVGTILWAKPVPKSDKLLELSVDFGETTPRTVVAGIGKTYTDPVTLDGVQALFVTNMPPAKLMGIESQGMILAVGPSPSELTLVTPTKPVPPGTRAK